MPGLQAVPPIFGAPDAAYNHCLSSCQVFTGNWQLLATGYFQETLYVYRSAEIRGVKSGPQAGGHLPILALVPACQWTPAQYYIPLAYAVTGMCVALLMSPTFVAGAVGLVLGDSSAPRSITIP